MTVPPGAKPPIHTRRRWAQIANRPDRMARTWHVVDKYTVVDVPRIEYSIATVFYNWLVGRSSHLISFVA
jgi:hypothetical protein